MNELLRAHVTRVGFDLSLGVTHIDALVRLDIGIRTRSNPRTTRKPDLFVAPGIGGLISRGLVVHHFNPKRTKKDGLRPHYTITPAGRYVLGLLKEAGLYEASARELRVA